MVRLSWRVIALTDPRAGAVCGETCARRGGADGVVSGCCNSLVLLAIEAGVLDAATVGASAAAVAPSAVGVTPAAAAVETLRGRPRMRRAWQEFSYDRGGRRLGSGVVVRLETAAVDSDAAVDSGATTVAFAGATTSRSVDWRRRLPAASLLSRRPSAPRYCVVRAGSRKRRLPLSQRVPDTADRCPKGGRASGGPSAPMRWPPRTAARPPWMRQARILPRWRSNPRYRCSAPTLVSRTVECAQRQ